MTAMPEEMTRTPDSAVSGLQAALEQTRLEGAIFLRAEFTENWAYESPETGLEEALHPGAARLLLFHLVSAGRCWVALADGERLWAEAGDVIVLPYGAQHQVGGEAPAQCIPITDLLAAPPWNEFPVINYGGGGERTEIICGYLHSLDPLFDPELKAFPEMFVVRLPDGPGGPWVESSIRYVAEATRTGSAPASPLARRLPELLLIEVLGQHLATAPAVNTGWVAAFRDPVLAPAMALMHASPERDWSVADLASACAVSRSMLDQRFRDVLGRSPIRYLTEWRLHLASNLLSNADLTVAAIAHRVGYQSEEAFSRAFKRAYGVAPSLRRKLAAE